MGRWVEVYCSCENRTPVPNSDYFGRPHRKKRRLTKIEKQEAEEWEQTTKNMYECGHRNGAVLEFSPGDILQLGDLIAGIFRPPTVTFEIFSRVSDCKWYVEELLLISPHEAAVWLMEIDKMRRGFRGLGDLPPERIMKLARELYRREVSSRMTLEKRLDKIAQEIPFARVDGMKRNLQQTEAPDMQSTLETIDSALTDAAKLCDASIETRNPIRFLW